MRTEGSLREHSTRNATFPSVLQANLSRYAPHVTITHRELDDSLAQKVRLAGKDPDIGRGANTYIAMWHHDPTWT